MPDRTIVTFAAAVVLLTACGTDAPGNAPEPAPDIDTVDGERLVGDLCTAADADDVEHARRAFMNAHGPLHDLASDVVESDRQVAARLHEAKQRVEVALDDGDADHLGRDLDELVDATRASLETVGQPVGGCDDDRNAP